MNNTKIVQSLWIGEKLSLFEEMCINSFIQNGYEFHLYVYSADLNVPDRTIKKDASQIIQKRDIFRNNLGKKTYTAFANLFRYKLLYEKGGFWVDMDVICLKELIIRGKYMFGSQGRGVVGNAVIYAEPKSKLMLELYNKSKGVTHQNYWGETGPTLLTKTIKKLELEKYILPSEVYYPVKHWETIKLIKNGSIPRSSETLHLWNEIILKKGINKKTYLPSWTLLGKIQRKYTPNKNINNYSGILVYLLLMILYYIKRPINIFWSAIK
ncbi:hypothetical protein JW758_03980 [Candidatus Peregrinibacteria bacterium]|nr:hypothetical protein [Candidatus Peregrinibacteria bacterium]